MASVQFGGGVTEIRGSIAGNVFSRNAGGAYLRARTTPINPATNRQAAVRDALAEAAQAWNLTLTNAQREAWNDYAAVVPWQNRLGQQIFLSGQNMYVRSNALILRAGATRVDDGPTIMELADPVIGLTASASEATQQLSIGFDDAQAWASEDGAFVDVRQGIPRNAGVSFHDGPFRQAGTLDGDSGTPITSPQTLATPWAAFVETNVLAVLARLIRADGRVGPATKLTFQAGA